MRNYQLCKTNNQLTYLANVVGRSGIMSYFIYSKDSYLSYYINTLIFVIFTMRMKKKKDSCLFAF